MDPPDNRPSRYRSTRRPGERSAAATPTLESTAASPNDMILRSPSRYHRKQSVASPTADAPSSDLPSPSAAEQRWSRPGGAIERIGRPEDAFAMSSREYLVSPTGSVPQDRVLTPKIDGEGRDRLDRNSASRHSASSRPGSREKKTGLAIDSARLSDRQGEARHDSPMFDARQAGSNAPQRIRATRVDVGEEKSAGCFGGLFGKRKAAKEQRLQQRQLDFQPSDTGENFIKQGGGGIVPGIDAPKSAANAGERRVLVECDRASMKFPVEPTTTVSDLLHAAADRFKDADIDPKSHILTEYYGRVGIQRSLRRYEHVRDIMNSWDDDHQNSLFIMPVTSASSDPDLLYASIVTSQRPDEKSFVLYYSQKVGKWDRRHIIVRSDGQIVAKKNSTALDKDAINVCHLTDFDIYTPTVRQTSKKIRPPKKLCFAIKSQQKTSMFESTEDFVHFFCTDRKDDAIAFYTAVQSWRSWYLVNVLGEGKKHKTKSAGPTKTPVIRHSDTAQHSGSASPTKPHHGLSKPVVGSADVHMRHSGFENDAITNGSVPDRTSASPAMQYPSSTQQVLADNEPLANYARRASVDDTRHSASFADSTRLTHNQSVRRSNTHTRDSPAQHNFSNNPPTPHTSQSPDPNVHPSTAIRRDPSHRLPTRGPSTRGPSSSTTADLARTASTRHPPKPLVDLTPTYREPPQHTRKGRGYTPVTVTSAGLIASATSPEDALGVPPATDWRGRNVATTQRSTSDTHDAARRSRSGSRSHSRPGSRDRARTVGSAAPIDNNTTAVPQPARYQNAAAHAALTGTSAGADHAFAANAAFVPGGLVEQTAGGWGDGATGRGLGGTAGKPLVDLRGEREFAKGSLLDRA